MRRASAKLSAVFHGLLAGLVGVVVVSFCAMLLTWGWHAVAPLHAHWLDAEELKKINTFLFGGTMVFFVLYCVRRMLAESSE